VSARLLGEAAGVAAQLEALGSGDATGAHLLAGRVALDLGRRQDADRHLIAAARSRRRGPALSRASGWLAAALRAEAADDPRLLLAACRRGLEVLDEHRFTLGASELQAQATAHGAELASLAQHHAVQSGQPRLLLTWSERWRATALAVPVVRPNADTQLNADLGALRDVTRRIEKARSRTRTDVADISARREQRQLEREQRRLEDAVRARALRTPAVAAPGRSPVSVPELLERLGSGQLVEPKGYSARSMGRGWPTSPRTGGSGRRAPCSPRCACTTGR
jgi:hypothetical protein